MKKLQNFLEENEISYETNVWGDDVNLDQHAYNKLYKFRNYMARRKSLDYQPIQSGTVKSFRVLTAVDSSSLKEHDEKRKEAIEAFWKNRHLKKIF